MSATSHFSLSLVGALLALTLPVQAQCFQDDNLEGPCWEPTQVVLPQFQDLSLPSSNICWDHCDLAGDNASEVHIDQPFDNGCGELVAELRVATPTFGTFLNGRLILDYTRTWIESAPGGNEHQVWRFAVKTDLHRTGPAPLGCPSGYVPDCLGAVDTAFYYGYMDYALDCVNNAWTGALVLFHNCDRFIHGSNTSHIPGTFHPTSTFAIVAPDAPLNPFQPVLSTAPSGALTAEAMRNVGPGYCVKEEPIADGEIQAYSQVCLCPSTGQPQVTLRRFAARGKCPAASDLTPSYFEAVDTQPYGLPWSHLQTTSIGTWTSPFAYPGQEVAWVDEGVFRYHDSCVVAQDPTQSGDFAEWFYGGSTANGWPVYSLSPSYALTQDFTDLASNYSGPAASILPTTPPPYVGLVLATRHLIYVNH